ncbi:MAG TPA: hypothetical protein VML50_08380 [Anaeromyxobacter sp.]|nr:hypothetical protein [Anaeromyxobacter sp.]
MPADPAALSRTLATAILGLDTLWGGDVTSPSGTGRFIADSWFSDEPLPEAHRHPAAARLRQAGGVGAEAPDLAAVDAYLSAVDVPGAIADLAAAGAARRDLRGAYLEGLAGSLQVMWELVRERTGRGPAVPYERCVRASIGAAPGPSRPEERRRRVAELLAAAGYPSSAPDGLLAAVDAWRRDRIVAPRSIPLLAGALVAQLDALALRHVVPHLPPALREIPRANVRFLSIADAWFSGSMNYLGRARRPDGTPEYEATYEVNASLQISAPELVDLVAHEVVPGHVTTFALLQALHAGGALGFEATVLTMNTRGAALSEGIANAALLLAHGVTAVEELPDPDLQLGMLLALLQDDAKNQASWLTWGEGAPQDEVAAVLRREFLCSEERAAKLSGSWGRHPLNGRMYLPCYRAGTEKLLALLRRHPAAELVPALYGARGLVDVVTIDRVLPQ